MSAAIGDLIAGKYRLLHLLGAGGWGKVYAGENVRTLHKVAIKILHPEMAARSDMIKRFEREAQAAGKIGSDHIIEVFDLGELPDDGGHYMVMELLEGEDLASRFKRGPMDPALLAPIVAQVLDGLASAHEAGILHRDLKPENLFLLRTRGGEDFVKILDFGISKFREMPHDMTVTGAVMGSPCYMSPEQARGSKEVDNRSDLFSIGVVLFEGATGRLPFEAENFNELLFKIALAEVPPDPRALRADLDPAFAAIIMKALQREPAKRWQSATELGRALAEWMGEKGLTQTESTMLRRARATPASSSSARIPVAERAHENAETLALVSAPRIAVAAASSSGDTPDLPRSHSAEVQVLSAAPGATGHARTPKRRFIAFAIPITLLALAGGVFTANRMRVREAAAGAHVDTVPERPTATQELVVPAPLESGQPGAPVSPAIRTIASAATAVPAAAPSGVASVKATAGGAVASRPLTRAASSPESAASSAPSAMPLGTVEGRQIRTGL